jgi:hypothetical protein
MSIRNWLEEFYPIHLEADVDYGDIGWEEITNQCIKKWEGCLPENLEKHELIQHRYKIKEGEGSFGPYFDLSNCGLCDKAGAIVRHTYGAGSICTYCPLKSTMGYPCDNDKPVGPWMAAIGAGNGGKRVYQPQHMIDALNETLEAIQQNQIPLHHLPD